MNWIESITYGPLNGGMNHGVLAFTVNITPNEPVAGADEIADAIMLIRKFPTGTNKVVRVTGKFAPKNDINMLTLLTSLKNSGYLIIAETDGILFHQWFTFPLSIEGKMAPTIDWLVVTLNKPVWPGFKVHELRYVLSGYDQVEPVLPKEVGGMQLYLIPPLNDAIEKSLSWIAKTDHKWRIFLSSPDEFSIPVGG